MTQGEFIGGGRNFGKLERRLQMIRDYGGATVPCRSRGHSFRVWALLKNRLPGFTVQRQVEYHDWDCRMPEVSFYVLCWRTK